MKNYKLTPQTKTRMLLIALFGALICDLILGYGFFAMSKQNWNTTKQCRESLNQINQAITSLSHKHK